MHSFSLFYLYRFSRISSEKEALSENSSNRISRSAPHLIFAQDKPAGSVPFALFDHHYALTVYLQLLVMLSEL